MAFAIPMMSVIGNLLGVTTQAAFVQSMIVVFAGGKTGLSAVVTGALYRLCFHSDASLLCRGSTFVSCCNVNEPHRGG